MQAENFWCEGRLLWRSQEGVYASLQGELCCLVFNGCGGEKGVVKDMVAVAESGYLQQALGCGEK